jgi:hypothetical protein
MRSAGLVTAKTSLAFHSWTVDTGPLVESNVEIWEDIAASLAKGKVEAAAAALRHRLEYVARLLANDLGAQPVFKLAIMNSANSCPVSLSVFGICAGKRRTPSLGDTTPTSGAVQLQRNGECRAMGR